MANDAVERAMKPIPIEAAKRIADEYGYDQVIVFARRVGEKPNSHGEHLTTYGVNKTHCGVAARVGNFLKTKVMGWYADDAGRNADRWKYIESEDDLPKDGVRCLILYKGGAVDISSKSSTWSALIVAYIVIPEPATKR